MKKSPFLLSFFAFAFIVTLFSGCSGDETESASITLTLDGQSKKIKTITGVLVFTTISGHEARGLNITGTLDNDAYFVIQVNNWDFQNPPANGLIKKKYFNITGDGIEDADCIESQGSTLCDGAMITYVPSGGSNEFYMSAFSDALDGFVEVTASNGKRVSGTFDLVITEASSEESIRATGTFNNVRYVVSDGF